MAKPREASAVELDIVVTPVGGQYAIGRVSPDHKIQSVIEINRHLLTALQRACELAGDDHRVFLAHSQRQTSALIDCTEVARQCSAIKNSSK